MPKFEIPNMGERVIRVDQDIADGRVMIAAEALQSVVNDISGGTLIAVALIFDDEGQARSWDAGCRRIGSPAASS